MASIRVSDALYRELDQVAGQLRTELGRPVSMEKVLEHLLKSRRLKPGDFAGAWDMSDKELQEVLVQLEIREHFCSRNGVRSLVRRS